MTIYGGLYVAASGGEGGLNDEAIKAVRKNFGAENILGDLEGYVIEPRYFLLLVAFCMNELLDLPRLALAVGTIKPVVAAVKRLRVGK